MKKITGKIISCVTASPDETKKLGGLLAKTILESGANKQARVLALSGDLGAGKTHFTQGFARGLGIKGTVNSPTFVILKKYLLENCGNFKTFYHIDCYRLGSGKDLEMLGIKSVIGDPANVVAFEWPDIAKDILLENVLRINFEVSGENERRIEFDS